MLVSQELQALATVTFSAMHEQEGMIQLFFDILLQQIAESYLQWRHTIRGEGGDTLMKD